LTLIWREATKADRPALQGFKCTDPAPREPGKRPGPHPRRWEDDVQKAIHSLPVPLSGADGVALLGLDGEDLAAVVVWSGIHGRPALYKLRLLAVSRERRTVGGNSIGPLARQALAEALFRIASEAPGADVFGLVDIRNRASQRVLTEAGLERVDGPASDPDLEMWAATLPISEDPDAEA